MSQLVRIVPRFFQVDVYGQNKKIDQAVTALFRQTQLQSKDLSGVQSIVFSLKLWAYLKIAPEKLVCVSRYQLSYLGQKLHEQTFQVPFAYEQEIRVVIGEDILPLLRKKDLFGNWQVDIAVCVISGEGLKGLSTKEMNTLLTSLPYQTVATYTWQIQREIGLLLPSGERSKPQSITQLKEASFNLDQI